MFTSNQSIGEIVAIIPRASEVFKKFKIDFCCGGHRPLSEAIKEQGLDEHKVLDQLQKVYEETQKYNKEVDFREVQTTQLIDYIINTHHGYLGRALPVISELVTTILKVHGAGHKDLFKIHKLFHNLKLELEQHLIKEEALLFPLIKEYDTQPSAELLKQIQETIEETEEEHDAAGDIIKELREITKEYTMPADGCGTYERAYKELETLESDLFQHIHLENNILFRRVGITNL
jgi:regulator of cell morphogenesis and NO signaling